MFAEAIRVRTWLTVLPLAPTAGAVRSGAKTSRTIFPPQTSAPASITPSLPPSPPPPVGWEKWLGMRPACIRFFRFYHVERVRNVSAAISPCATGGHAAGKRDTKIRFFFAAHSAATRARAHPVLQKWRLLLKVSIVCDISSGAGIPSGGSAHVWAAHGQNRTAGTLQHFCLDLRTQVWSKPL
eukprot:gene3142-biopygen3651